MKITTLMLGELASNCYIQEVGNKKCVIVDIGGDAPIVFRRLEMMQLEPLAILLTHGITITLPVWSRYGKVSDSVYVILLMQIC